MSSTERRETKMNYKEMTEKQIMELLAFIIMHYNQEAFE